RGDLVRLRELRDVLHAVLRIGPDRDETVEDRVVIGLVAVGGRLVEVPGRERLRWRDRQLAVRIHLGRSRGTRRACAEDGRHGHAQGQDDRDAERPPMMTCHGIPPVLPCPVLERTDETYPGSAELGARADGRRSGPPGWLQVTMESWWGFAARA